MSSILILLSDGEEDETPPIEHFCHCGIYPYFIRFFEKGTNQAALEKGLQACQYLYKGTDEQQLYILGSGLMRPLVNFCMHSSPVILIPARISVANLLSGSDTVAQFLINAGIGPEVYKIVQHARANLKEGNTSGGEPEASATCQLVGALYRHTILNASQTFDCVLLLQEHLQRCKQFSTHREALMALNSIISEENSQKSPDLRDVVIRTGIITTLMKLSSVFVTL